MAPPTVLSFGDFTLEGRSRAGDETWLRVRPPGLAFDAGRGALELTGCKNLFLSHGHLDHSLGVPFVLSHRTLHRADATRVFCPREVAPRLEALIEAASALEEKDYRYRLTGLDPGDRIEVGPDLVIEAFRTSHVVASLGYHLVARKRRLAPAYRDRPGEELAALRRDGVEIEEVSEERRLSYCGDTGPETFELEPALFTSRVLVVECTFLAPEHRDKGRRFAHLHLDDLVALADRFANEHLVLHHLSRRYPFAALAREAAERLAGIAPEIHVLGEVER